jgi:hypothetical protein
MINYYKIRIVKQNICGFLDFIELFSHDKKVCNKYNVYRQMSIHKVVMGEL